MRSTLTPVKEKYQILSRKRREGTNKQNMIDKGNKKVLSCMLSGQIIFLPREKKNLEA